MEKLQLPKWNWQRKLLITNLQNCHCPVVAIVWQIVDDVKSFRSVLSGFRIYSKTESEPWFDRHWILWFERSYHPSSHPMRRIDWHALGSEWSPDTLLSVHIFDDAITLYWIFLYLRRQLNMITLIYGNQSDKPAHSSDIDRIWIQENSRMTTGIVRT